MNFMKNKCLTTNALKCIAIVVMFFDHYFSVFIEHESILGCILRIPGRLAAPIMCYLIAEGFYHTSNIKKYLSRLFLLAVVSHFPFVLYYDLIWWKASSVALSLFLGLLALIIVKSDKYPIIVKVLSVLICCMIAYPADWNYIAVLWIVAFGIFYGDFKKQMLCFFIIGIFLEAVPTVLEYGIYNIYQFATVLAIPVLYMYSGKQGKKNKFIKWGFYIFYPAHLILLNIVKCIFSI